MITWEYVSAYLTLQDFDEDLWETDLLYLALNYGNCYLEGKHPNTPIAHWKLFENAIKNREGYGEEICKNLFYLMNNDQKNILQTLLEEGCVSEDSE